METRTLDIPVILPDYYEDCDRCLDRLRTALGELDGVKSVEIDSEHQKIALTYDSNYVSIERIENRARQLGIEITKRYAHESLQLEGLDCPDCAMKLEKGVGRLAGVVWTSVNYATSILAVEYKQSLTGHEKIVGRVRDLGYDVAAGDGHGGARTQEHKPTWFNRKAVATSIAGAFLIAGILASMFGASSTVLNLIYGASIIAGGFYAARAGVLSLRAAGLDTNLLVTLAAVGAISIGEWGEAAGVLFLFALGNALESFTVDRTRNSIRGLVDLSPMEASVMRDGVEQRVRVDEIAVGEIVVVRPGERIAMDGVVSAGASSVDEKAITGESVPREKTAGSIVYAGTINQRGSLDVRVTRLVGDNTLSQIIHLVEEAQARKAPTQQFSERFGRIYTPLVVGTAVVLGIVSLITRDPMLFKKSLVLLVVACPCALVISTPVAIVAAIGNAARNGVLVKGGAYLEEMGRVAVIAFDKTGTLTTGNLEVTDVISLDGDEEDVLRVAASIESRSEHPLGEAILRSASERGIALSDLAFFEAIPGLGARGMIDSRLCHIGNQRMLDRMGVEFADESVVERLRSEGKTLMFVISEGKAIGIVAASDTVRESSRDALAAIRRLAGMKTVMLTGDNMITARAVAEDLGIDSVEAELLPEEKVDRVRHLVERHGKVAMVGDGINDAPALAAASVGVAMGGAGAHAALETADVALMADDLSMLPYGIRLSRAALRIIKQNIAFSVIIVVALVALTLTGKMTLTGGILGHEGSALIVITNGMRLLRMRA